MQQYHETTLDYDNRFGRYSVGSPSPSPSPSVHSSVNSSSGLIANRRGIPYGLVPTAPVLYSFEKEDWNAEDDDLLHAPGRLAPRVGRSRMITELSGSGFVWSWRGALNVVGVIILLGGIIALFAGYPIISYVYSTAAPVNTTSFISGTPNTTTSTLPPGVSSNGIINSNAPNITNRGLIDPDTPSSAYTMMGVDGVEMELVFSDEFNVAGRTFYPGEDPYWEAVNLHYYATDDLEWYDPGNIITEGGYLAITLTSETLADSHGLGYLGGMLQSWNKFCMTGGRVVVAASLPGSDTVSGLWPSAWMMGNLGRPGYGATTDGTWPYSYDSCDVGTLANQTNPATGGPTAATLTGLPAYANDLSYLPGQRLSRCTCPGSNHPGPMFANGSYPGRSAPEIDLFEATASPLIGGQVSQSAQFAPYNPYYRILNATTSEVDYAVGTIANTYMGDIYQQSVSALTDTVASAYNSISQFSTYGVEYTPTYLAGPGTGEINWLQNDAVTWTLSDTAMAANAVAGVGQRQVSGEPMSLIMNLGMSESFGTVDIAQMTFPATMRFDYIRVYQPVGSTNIGCDPPLYPTADYIANNLEPYHNMNMTIWSQFNGAQFPKNSLIDTC